MRCSGSSSSGGGRGSCSSWSLRFQSHFGDGFAAAVFTPALWRRWIQRAEWPSVLIDAGVLSVDVHESEAQVTFTEEAPERVHTFPATRTHASTQETLVDVDTGASVWPQA